MKPAGRIRCKIFHGWEEIQEFTDLLQPTDEYSGTYEISFSPRTNDRAGYGMIVYLDDKSDENLAVGTTAFDVLENWSEWPRYGFITDFSSNRSQDEIDHTMQHLTDFHINGLQFYDWQYRHDDLIAPSEEYLDPLGRELSLTTIRNLIRSAHEYNIAAIPYTAVYAVSYEFWKANPQLALYDGDGKAIAFGDHFLGLMDPTRGSGWSNHLLRQFQRVLSEMKFDGIHIDQYGDPKTGSNASGEAVDLPQAFVDIISDTHELTGKPTTLFNAVGNWPIEVLARSNVAFLYIEIWPPDVTYQSMVNILMNARKLSGGKPVVLAQYIHSEDEANVLTASTLAMACGCCRIELGEDLRLLSDPYFPKHEAISMRCRQQLKLHYDFFVRYEEWILKTNEMDEFSQPFTDLFMRKYSDSRGMIINLVQIPGGGLDANWNINHPDVNQQVDKALEIKVERCPVRAYYATPDDPATGIREITYRYQDGIMKLELPLLNYWGLLEVRYE